MENADFKNLVFLVVDDDSQVRHILTEYLKSFGFHEIVQAKDGMSALQIVHNHSQRIDFVISDWEMPKVDGLTLLRAIRNDPRRGDAVKFIMVSSQSSRERMKISKAARSRVDAYVVKPFRSKVLHEKIQNLLNGQIDSSVEEFEGLLKEVPSNEQLAKAKDKKVGKVLMEPETKGAGIVASLKRLAENGPKKIRAKPSDALVPNMNPGDEDEAETVNEFMDQVFGENKPEGAENTLPDNYDLNKMSPAQVLKLAKAYIQGKLYDKAIRLCLDAHFIFPTNADILVHAAIAYRVSGDEEAAWNQLKKATKIDPYHIEAQTLLAESNFKKTG